MATDTEIPVPAAPVAPVAEAPAAPVVPAEAQVVELPAPAAGNEDADFAAAFDALHVEKPVVEPTKPVPVAPAAEAPAPSPAPTPAAPVAEVPAPDLAAQFAAVQAELAELKKGITPPVAAAPAPAAPPVVPPTYTTDEQATIDKYLTDWSEVAQGEALMRRAEYQQVVGHVFKVLQPQLEQLAQLQEMVQTQGSRTLYSDLTNLIPDYDAVREPTLAWIQTQPAYLKAAYQRVADEGSAQDVADLIGRFRKETGYAAPAGAAAPAPSPTPAAPNAALPVKGAAAKPAVSAAAAAAAALLKPVVSGRSDPPQAQDPGDFDAAWKEALTAEK